MGKAEGKQNVGIRGVDSDVWRKIKVKAMLKKVQIGDFVSHIFRDHLEKEEEEKGECKCQS